MSISPLNLTLLDDEQFEDLVEAIFRAKAPSNAEPNQQPTEVSSTVISIARSGRGQDAGRDLLVTTMVRDCIAPRLIRWVVQCKHKAVSGRSVAPQDFVNDFAFPDILRYHNANSYLLVCSTRPSAKLQALFDNLTNDSNTYQYIVWDYAQLCEAVFSNESVMKQFFPEEYNHQRRLIESCQVEEWANRFDGSISPEALAALNSIIQVDNTRSEDGGEEGAE